MDDTRDPDPPLLSPAAPGRREPLELLARVMSVAMLGWLGVTAAFTWRSYGAGYAGLLLPIWNSLFVIAMIPIVHGVFERRLWGQRWVAGTSLLTGISHALTASRADSTLLWCGALLLFAVAFVMQKAQPLFNDSDGNRGKLQQTMALVAMVGSVVVALLVART